MNIHDKNLLVNTEMLYHDITSTIIGCSFEIMKELGIGFFRISLREFNGDCIERSRIRM